MRVICDKEKLSKESISFSEDVDEDISSDGLEIDISETLKNEPAIDIEDIRVLENIEEEIERQYDEKAAKSNLSAINVKNILKHVITNEHVWAMVRNTTEDNVAGGDHCIYEPKLTRAKAKELLKTQSAAAIPWVKPKPKSEVHILINEDLPDDSDDDEYVPHEDEQSEDEKESCNPSDVDSLPATPATPASTHDTSTQTNWTEDGVFKIPQPTKSTQEEDSETIALRTRSKLSLSDTPLETIEEAFIPPDITTDMYDFECDDEDWRDFLKKFTRPLDEAVHGTQEDDDEADPEYNVLADEEIDAIDKEELRQDKAVKVTKKELNNLVAELFEFSEMFTNAKELEKGQQNVAENTSLPIENNPQIVQQPDVVLLAEPVDTKIISDVSIVAPVDTIITKDQLLLFEQQKVQHVQMLTQNFVLTYRHPVLAHMAPKYKNMVLSFRELSKYKVTSAFDCYNLNMAVSFISEWEEMVNSNSDEVQEMMEYVEDVVNKYRTARGRGQNGYICTFPPLLLKKVSESSVFIFPSLLPKIPFRCSLKERNFYLPSENELIAIGLEQFIPYMETQSHFKTRFGKLRLADVAHLISKHMMPHREGNKLYSHIKSMNDKKMPPNPIKFYFLHKRAPATVHYVVPLSEFGVVPPCMRPPDTLPYQWKTFLYPQTKIPPCVPVKKVQKPPAYNKKPAQKKRVVVPKLQGIENHNQVIIINNIDVINSKSEVKTPQYIIIDLDNKVAIPQLPSTSSPKTRVQKRRPRKRKVLPKIEEIYLQSPENPSEKFLCENSFSNKIAHSSIITTSRNDVKQGSGKVAENNKIDPGLLNLKFNSSIFKHLKDSDMLPSMPFLLTPVKDPNSGRETETTSVDPIEENKIEKPASPEIIRPDETENIENNETNDTTETPKDDKKDDENEINALMIASSTMQQKNKRIQSNLTKKAKQMREYNATLAMLCPEDQTVVEEKAKNFAQAYYDKVQERLENESPLEYQKFMEALSEHDETRSTVSDLYEKVSSVLSPKHSDLCDEFLTFLTPEQAKQIGKLVPHFMLSNMSLFLRKLEIYYTNQPAQLRRIYNSLTELADTPDVTMDKVRQSILPLLKGNAQLIDWFLQMFPNEAPPGSLMTDWEQVSCDDGDDVDDDEKVFETITLPEVEDPYGGPNCICKCHSIADEMYASRARHCIPCGTKFLQGRVYIQTGKGLRLANVTFNNTPHSDHNKRLSVSPIARQKRKSDSSPSKLLLSPTKPDDEPRHSNESEDDINTTDSTITKKVKSIKPFRTSSPTKSRKKPISKSKTPKPKDTVCKSKTNKKVPAKQCSSTKLITVRKPDECSTDLQEELNIPDTKTEESCKPELIKSEQVDCDFLKSETVESETEVCEWDAKTSPGHSVESMDTCEESSQDTIDAQGSESDNDSTVEVESVISGNSEDSNSQQEETSATDSQSWTRDEDKVILQTFQERGNSQTIFKDIHQLLEGRSVSEIRQRFQTLMSLLQEMASTTN